MDNLDSKSWRIELRPLEVASWLCLLTNMRRSVSSQRQVVESIERDTDLTRRTASRVWKLDRHLSPLRGKAEHERNRKFLEDLQVSACKCPDSSKIYWLEAILSEDTVQWTRRSRRAEPRAIDGGYLWAKCCQYINTCGIHRVWWRTQCLCRRLLSCSLSRSSYVSPDGCCILSRLSRGGAGGSAFYNLSIHLTCYNSGYRRLDDETKLRPRQ